jgi:hypothetical protein
MAYWDHDPGQHRATDDRDGGHTLVAGHMAAVVHAFNLMIGDSASDYDKEKSGGVAAGRRRRAVRHV